MESNLGQVLTNTLLVPAKPIFEVKQLTGNYKPGTFEKATTKAKKDVPDVEKNVLYASRVLTNSLPKTFPGKHINAIANVIGITAGATNDSQKYLKMFLKKAIHMFDEEYSETNLEKEKIEFEKEHQKYKNTDMFFAAISALMIISIAGLFITFFVTVGGVASAWSVGLSLSVVLISVAYIFNK